MGVCELTCSQSSDWSVDTLFGKLTTRSPLLLRSNASSSSRSSRKRKSSGGGRNNGGNSKGGGERSKKSKSDSKKKGEFSSYIESWPSFFTAKAILLLTSLGFVLDSTLETIPLGGRIKHYIDNWRLVTSNDWVLNVVSKGYQIPFKTIPHQTSYPVNPPAKGNAFDVLVSEADALLSKNAVRIVSKTVGEYVSSYFAVPKPRKLDQFRPILNLKYFNNFVKKYRFKMETLSSVRDWIKPGAYVIGLDLRDAFLHIPMNEDSRKYLRFRWLDQLYEWIVLPFGLTCSPRVITKVLKPVVAFLRSIWGILISIYIDDIIIQHTDPSQCSLHAQLVALLFNSLGWSFKPEKCEIIPTQKFSHLGFNFDTTTMLISCPADKVSRLQEMCSNILLNGKCKLLDMERLIGTIESVRPAVKYAALYYRSLQYQMLQAKKGDRNPNKTIILSQKSREELEWWISPNGFQGNCCSPIREPQPTVSIWSDANLKMGGSHCSRGNFIQREWEEEEMDLHINFLELRAARESLSLAKPGDMVRLHLDNVTALTYILKQGGTRSRLLNTEACQLWKEAIAKKINLLSPVWLSTKENMEADFLSRNHLHQWECMLSRETFLLILDHFSLYPTLDVYASRETHQLRRYMSWYQDPQAVAQNALIHPWDPVSYLFPPVPMVMKSLHKIKDEKVEVIMVIPHWPTSLWWPLILELMVEPLLPLPHYKMILSMTNHLDLPYLNPLVAVHLKA